MFATIESKLIAAAVIALLVGGAIFTIYHKGENAGSSAVTSAVEKATIDATQNATKTKENADAKVNAMPADAVIDSTR